MSMWGGRFESSQDETFKAFNDSLVFDYRLLRHDVNASIAWARSLTDIGVLTEGERADLVGALRTIAMRAAQNPTSVRDSGEEDVHSYVETRLVEMLGDLGKKLHTGRSRNDQVATDLRLYIREQVLQREHEIRDAQRSLIGLAEREHTAVLPGFTHLQRAQPVPLAHWCMAWVEMLERDIARLHSAYDACGRCPLGSGALAGTAYPIDREALAELLGFDGPTANSIDAACDRDFVLDALHALASCGLHLSRLAEDLILYASQEFGFVRVSDAVSTGSSLMPQKKNPDALELIRGKAGRLVGAQISLSVTLKGLPTAYNKDLQEDKEPLFDAMDTLSICLRVLPAILDGLVVDAGRTLEAAKQGHANATDLADYLVEKGVAFRDAHEIVGRMVREAIDQGVGLEELPLSTMRTYAGCIGPDVYDRLSVDAVLDARDVIGGTARARVRGAVAAARSRVDEASASALAPTIAEVAV